MSKNMTVILPFLAIVVVAVVEYLVARAWRPAYFRYGLPLFRKRVEGVRLDRETEARVVDLADKEESLIDFQRLSESEIAFREQSHAVILRSRYTPILHGLLRYVPEEGATYVIGWLNFVVIAAFGAAGYIFFYGSLSRKPWAVPLVVLLGFGVLYAIGVWRYRMVAKWLENRS